MPFLTARWTNLILVSYAVEPARLQPLLPPGCVLDERDGHAFVSLVAFDFLDTKVLGLGWPGFRNFPEINLRFYVRHEGQRGVVFVREFVPSRLVAGIARGIYNEPYRAARMSSEVARDASELKVSHHLEWRGSHSRVQARAAGAAYVPPESSDAHFFKEHSWGFGKSRSGALVRYQVEHPVWKVHDVDELALDWKWSAVYGDEWQFLAAQKPFSTILAVGSEIAVYPKS